jgi:hypothetical protein
MTEDASAPGKDSIRWFTAWTLLFFWRATLYTFRTFLASKADRDQWLELRYQLSYQ